MAENILTTRIVLRNDIAATWASVNPVLLAGEVGVERDTRKIKIGDSITAWNDLPYANVTPEELKGATISELVNTNPESTDEMMLETLMPGKGDIAIVITMNGEAEDHRNSYAYNGEKWTLIGGTVAAKNIDAENADGKSIEIVEGILTMKGFGEAATGQQPRVGTDGTIEWYTPDTSTVSGLADTVAGHTADIAALAEDKADKATTLAGYGITDAYTKEEVDGLVSGAFHFKGSVTSIEELPEDAKEGDVYLVEAESSEFAFNGEEWIELGSEFDLSAYQTTEQADAKYVAQVEGKVLSTNDLTNELKAQYDAVVEFTQGAFAPADAQANIIESVMINGEALAVNEQKAIDIPVAGALLGVVKSSDAMNGVTVNEDGTMTVNSISMSKLVNDESQTIILSGGGAAI